jgi:biopolymer transport protein ExbD
MAQIESGGGGHGKHDKKRAKKLSTRIDMTPMVDLAFLLLTFFVLTSTFSKPKTLRMIFPEKKENPNEKDITVYVYDFVKCSVIKIPLVNYEREVLK